MTYKYALRDGLSVCECAAVMWEVVCHAFVALRAVKQGQATPAAT